MLTIIPQYLNVSAAFTLGPNNALTGITAPLVNVINLNNDGLRIVWNVTMTNTSTPNSGVVEIYNLSRANIAALENIMPLVGLGLFGATIRFGWGGVIGTCLNGAAFKVTAKEETMTDIITRIEFGENIKPPTTSIIQISNGQVPDIFRQVALEVGYPLSLQFTQALSTIPLVLSNQVFAAVFVGGKPEETMNILVAGLGPGYSWDVIDGKIYLLNGGAFMDTTPPHVLRADTGLLNYSLIDDGGVQTESLGHPDIRPGQQIIVQDSLQKPIGGGPLRVESVSWSGDTRTGCKMSIISRKLSVFA